MEMYPISKTMFVSSYNYKDLTEGDFLFRDNFYSTRVINLRRGPDLGFRTACGDGAICEYGQEDNRPERLTCAPWFKRFLSTAFECGKGRLLQKSGTCYMTTVFNMFLLGKYLRHILVSKMNNYVSTHPSTIDDITLPIVTKCPLINNAEAVSIYTFRLLYSTLCDIDVFKKIVKRPPYVDIFSEGADAYFKPKLTSISGGWAFNVLYKVFHTLGINFKIAGIDADRDMAVMEPVDIEQNVLRSKYHNQLFFDDIYMQNIIKRSADGAVLRDTPIEECDCIIIYNDTGSIIQPVSESQADAYLRSKNFEPEVCAIVIDSTDTGPGHVVMGFRCEDEYKIFDSNGRILEYDWYTGTKDEMKIMGKDLKTPYPTLSDTNIHLSFAIYINSAKKAQIEREGSKCFDGKKVL